MTIARFEDIISWQKAQDLAEDIYLAFGQVVDFSFRDQIRRAAISISNNISEGFERGSDADFARMLYIAKGSAGEVRSMIYLAMRLGYIAESQKANYLERCAEISRLISALIKSISTKGKSIGSKSQ